MEELPERRVVALPRGALVVAAAVAVAVLAVLVAAASGPVRWGSPLPIPRLQAPPRAPVPSQPPEASLPPPTACTAGCGETSTAPVLHLPSWLFVLAAAVALLVVVLRLRRRLVAGVSAADDDEAAPDPVPEPGAGPAVHDALAAASAELDDAARAPRDAVVAVWLRLEEGAAAAGVPRRPAQTPTEFTRALLTGATGGREAEAVDELLHLYHRARFGRGELPAGAGQRAARALARIRAALTGGLP